MYKKILIPLDGSTLAEAPLRYAAWLALRTDVEFTLLNVYSEKIAPRSSYLKETGQILYLKSHEHKGSQLPPLVKEVSVRGDPATEILKYANDNNIDLIAMSTHGHSGVKHWLLGGIADRVVRYSNMPVWIIKSFEIGEKTDYDQKVLVLLDGSVLAEQILPYATFHASLRGGELILLSVCEPPDIIPPVSYHLTPDSYPPKRPVQWYKYAEKETERRQKECQLYLEKAVKAHSGNKFTVRSEYRFGEPADEIVEYMRSNPVSLVAMTTRGRSGLSIWALGSMAEKVLSVATSPILIMKPHGVEKQH